MKSLFILLLLSAGIYVTWDDYIIPVINKYLPREIEAPLDEVAPLDEGETEKKKIEGLEKKIEDIVQEALRAQAEGDKKAQSSLERRIKLARRIVDIMKTSGVSQEEATMLANRTSDDMLDEIDPVRDDPAQAHLNSMYGERDDFKKQVRLLKFKMSSETDSSAKRATDNEIEALKLKIAKLTYKIEDLEYRYPYLVPSK